MIESYITSHIGGRSSQQDAACILHDSNAELVGCAVFDGAGAMEHGAEAANASALQFTKSIGAHSLGHLRTDVSTVLNEAFAAAQQRITTAVPHNIAPSATTAVVAIVVEGHAIIAWCGDSKVWLWRAGGLVRITRPHCVAEEAWCAHSIGRDEVGRHPQSHVITRAINTGTAPSRPDFRVLQVHPDDMLMLASDGLDAVLEDRDICHRINQCPPRSTTKHVADDLLRAALRRHTPDNISVGLIRVLDPHRHAPEIPVPAGVRGAVFDHQHAWKELHHA